MSLAEARLHGGLVPAVDATAGAERPSLLHAALRALRTKLGR